MQILDKRKAKFKTNKGNNSIQSMFIVDETLKKSVYLGMDEFSSAGFGYKKDDSALRIINKMQEENITKVYLENFDKVWNDEKS